MSVPSPKRPARAARQTHRSAPPPLTTDALRQAGLAYLAKRDASARSLRQALERRITRWLDQTLRATAQGDNDRGNDGSTATPPSAEAAAQSTAQRARHAIDEIIESFRVRGLINDARFAERNVSRLAASGRSKRAIAARLAAKGIDEGTAREALASSEVDELQAALTFAKKRRLGPFGESNVEIEDTSDTGSTAEYDGTAATDDMANHDPSSSSSALVSAAVSSRARKLTRSKKNSPNDARMKALGMMARAGFSFALANRVLAMTTAQAECNLRDPRDD